MIQVQNSGEMHNDSAPETQETLKVAEFTQISTVQTAEPTS